MKRLFILILFTSHFAVAQEPTKRSKSINFEDEVVEGINRKPLDAFNQLTEQNGRGKNHLYHKRAGFSDRDETLLTEMRLAQ
jgi:hypothetical protein